MAAYRRVYDSRYLQADCQEPGSAPEPYARQSSMGSLYLFYTPCMGLSLASLVCSGGVLAARRRDADGRLRQCRAVHAAQVGAHHEDHQATIHRCYDVVERLCRRHASMYTSGHGNGGDREHRCCLLVYTPLLLAHVVNSDSVAVFKHRLACVNFS